MNAVVEHGTPLVDDPDRVGPVRQLGVDETSFLRGEPLRIRRSTRPVWSISIGTVVIDMVDGNTCR